MNLMITFLILFIIFMSAFISCVIIKHLMNNKLPSVLKYIFITSGAVCFLWALVYLTCFDDKKMETCENQRIMSTLECLK